MLFLADVPDQVRVLTIYGRLKTGFRNPSGQEVLFVAPDATRRSIPQPPPRRAARRRPRRAAPRSTRAASRRHATRPARASASTRVDRRPRRRVHDRARPAARCALDRTPGAGPDRRRRTTSSATGRSAAATSRGVAITGRSSRLAGSRPTWPPGENVGNGGTQALVLDQPAAIAATLNTTYIDLGSRRRPATTWWRARSSGSDLVLSAGAGPTVSGRAPDAPDRHRHLPLLRHGRLRRRRRHRRHAARRAGTTPAAPAPPAAARSRYRRRAPR